MTTPVLHNCFGDKLVTRKENRPGLNVGKRTFSIERCIIWIRILAKDFHLIEVTIRDYEKDSDHSLEPGQQR